MRILGIFAALAITSLLSRPSFAGNGVERGEIPVTSHSSIPKGVEDRIETVIFSNCDLRGAHRIDTNFVSVNEDPEPAGMDSISYSIQYSVNFDNRYVMIYVRATQFLDSEMGGAIVIREFQSPICQGIKL